MADLALDMDPVSVNFGDLLLTNGDLVITPTTLYGIQQHILQRLRIYLGEWFLNTTIGVAYFQLVLVKNPDESKVDAIFQSTIIQTPGVVSLTSYSFNPNFATRQLEISFSALTTNGTVDYSGLISV